MFGSGSIAQLLQQLAPKPIQYEGMLGELRKAWQRDPGRAVLWARYEWQRIPEQVVAMAAQVQGMARMQAQAFRDSQAINQSVNIQLGTLGISPGFGGYSGGYSAPIGPSPDEIMFLAVMAAIRAHHGDPPTNPAVVSRSEAVVTGQVDPMEVYHAAGGNQYGSLIQMAAGLAGQFGSILRLQGLVAAAMAVPRARLAPLLGIHEVESRPAGGSATKARDDAQEERHRVQFSRRISKVRELLDTHETKQAESLIAEALQIARASATPDDDIEGIQYATLLALRVPVNPELIRTTLAMTTELIANNRRVEDAAYALTALGTIIQGQSLTSELGSALLAGIRDALNHELPATLAIQLRLQAATSLLCQGNAADAEDWMKQAKSLVTSPGDILDISVTEADIAWARGDRDGAAETLIAALDEQPDAEPEKRALVLQKLVAVWPDGKAGFERWLGEAERGMSALSEPEQSIGKLTLLLNMIRGKNFTGARAFAARVDLAAMRARLPEHLHPMLAEVEAAVSAMETATGILEGIFAGAKGEGSVRIRSLRARLRNAARKARSAESDASSVALATEKLVAECQTHQEDLGLSNDQLQTLVRRGELIGWLDARGWLTQP